MAALEGELVGFTFCQGTEILQKIDTLLAICRTSAWDSVWPSLRGEIGGEPQAPCKNKR